MFKWHVNSGIGRSRPVGNDFLRVADGIAASLRHFSISVSKNAEDTGSGDGPKITRTSVGFDRPQISRSQRGAEASKEINSLGRPAPRGIDARSLAAKPPVLRITRIDSTRTVGRGGSGGGMRGRGRGGGGDRGRRGGRGGRGGGRIKKKRDTGARKRDGEEDALEDPWTEEELLYLEGREQGWTTPWKPETSPEALVNQGPAVMSSPRGVNESIIYKMQVATGKFPGYDVDHALRISRGNGTIFENVEDKAMHQAFKDLKDKERAEKDGEEYIQEDFGSLSPADREAIKKQWVSGQYISPAFAQQGNVLGHVEAYLRRNETYLPGDLDRLEGKLKSLLPAQLLKSKPGTAKAPL